MKYSYLFVAHHPESDDQVNAEKQSDCVVTLSHVLLNVSLKNGYYVISPNDISPIATFSQLTPLGSFWSL